MSAQLSRSGPRSSNHEFRSPLRAHCQVALAQGLQGQARGHGTGCVCGSPELGFRPDQEVRRGGPEADHRFQGQEGPPDGSGFLHRHHGRALAQGPARPQGDRHQGDRGPHRRQSGPVGGGRLAGLSQQRRHGHRDRADARRGAGRGALQEVVVRRQEGDRQGSAHFHPGQEDRVLHPARDPGFRRGRDRGTIPLHAFGPPPHQAGRGPDGRGCPQGGQGRSRSRSAGTGRCRPRLEPAGPRRAPLRCRGA